MKNCFKIFGIISMILVIGFSMTACQEDEGGGAPSFEGTWKGNKQEYDISDLSKPPTEIPYTVTISGDSITIKNEKGEVSGTLKEVEETTGGWSRGFTIGGGIGNAWINDRDTSKLNFSLSGDDANRAALGFTGTLMVSDMTK